MKILFICKYNRFRSKVAEAIFNQLNRNKTIETKGAGINIDIMHPFVADSVKKIMLEKGYPIKNEKSRQLNDFDIKWADRIIVVANNVSPDIFPPGKTEFWEIEDADEADIKTIKKVIEDIEERVKKLINIINS